MHVPGSGRCVRTSIAPLTCSGGCGIAADPEAVVFLDDYLDIRAPDPAQPRLYPIGDGGGNQPFYFTMSLCARLMCETTE